MSSSSSTSNSSSVASQQPTPLPSTSSSSVMASNFTFSQTMVRNLSDKMKEKRRLGGEEIESMVKKFLSSHDENSIHKLLQNLNQQFVENVQPNHRKGGLWGLAAAAIALYKNVDFYLSELIPPVLKCFTDQDNKVRFHACEALYNIVKVARSATLPFFNSIFNGMVKLCADSDVAVKNANQYLDRLLKDIITEGDEFDVGKFIPLISDNITTNNPYVRQFLVGWILMLDSVPDIFMLDYLPQFLNGLFLMLNDSNKEITNQAVTALEEFLHEIEENAESVDFGPLVAIVIEHCSSQNFLINEKALVWVYYLLVVGNEKLLPFNASILGAILPCVSHKQEVIRRCAAKANLQLMKLIQDTKSMIEYDSLIHVILKELSKLSVPSRLASLQWLNSLLNKSMDHVLQHIDKIFALLLKCLSDESNEDVVRSCLEVLAILSSTEQNFSKFLTQLVEMFKQDRQLLNDKSGFIIRNLSIMLNPEKIYREFSKILLLEANLEFCSLMIETLNMILLTSKELSELRSLIKNSTSSEEGKDLFISLYMSWCHNPISTLCLCLLAKAYEHASSLVMSFSEIEVTVSFLVQIDNMVQLLESPVFSDLRLQLLEPHRNPYLLKTLYGILMLLPQSTAYEKLNKRLQCVSTLSILHVVSSQQDPIRFLSSPPGASSSSSATSASQPLSNSFEKLLDHFKTIQDKHRLARSGEL